MNILIILANVGLVLGIIGGVFFLLVLFILSYVKAGPDTAIMVSGAGKKKILIGKAGFRIPFLQRTDKLSLKAFQVDIKTEEAIPTTEFININVDGSTWDEEVKTRATSLKLEFNKDFDRSEITALYLNHFEELYIDFLKNLDLSKTIEICRNNSNVFGKRAKLITYNNEEIVTCTGLTDTGNLIVRDSNGLEKIIFSGEITFHNID